ncbi:MAG: DNA-directed RNA polymerase subunit alpha [Gemmatimonadetes bacterium]|nr:DNA-directed RNA polymerase subunit alpha [Gemmatimonadota bacterium]MXW81361.1 DNA-directed RNA polymerase subunit alpha [Gemmatimonadota bacterium]MYC73403.1 DNA-directed RNA polymerase subunit alpha [Gemmatimonadota bacterium]MYI64279.1 DNA-directed RNA polymerase subunit alpha [Gemmatimonadota bacterium]
MKLEGLQMPRLAEVEKESLSETYGMFIVQPLERGFGVSIGHALRRVLLSFIQGAAIKQVNIEGVHHEFSTIEGVREDVPEIVRNFKEIALRYRGAEDRVLRVERTTEGALVAKDIEVDPSVEVLNPDLHLATLDKGASLKMELTVGCGRGYLFAEENKIPEQPIGAIPLDTNYSPVLKVHYDIENARVGRRTDYDKLIMEVWTDGSVHPEDAMSQAAQILTEHLNLFINFTEEPEGIEEKEVDEEAKKIVQLLQTPVEEIELTVRSANCLKAAGITHLRDLVSRTEAEMLQYRNFGRKSLNELQKILEENNLSWGMDLTPYDGIEIDQTADSSLAEEF